MGKALYEGLAFCGGCGRKLVYQRIGRTRACAKYVCPGQCGIRGIREDELREGALCFVRAVCAPEVCRQLEEALAEGAKALLFSREREAESRKADASKDIELMRKCAGKAYMPPDLTRRLEKILKEIEQAVMDIEPAAVVLPDVKDYFSMGLPDDPAQDPEGAQRAIEWYIQRLTVHRETIQIESTFDSWLRKNARW